MNLGKLVSSALKAVPVGIRGTVTITKIVRGVYNPQTGARDDAPSSFTCSCVMVPPKPVKSPDGAMRVPEYTKEILIAAHDCTFPVLPGMTATIRGVVWRVIVVMTLDPTGTDDVLYTLGVSK